MLKSVRFRVAVHTPGIAQKRMMQRGVATSMPSCGTSARPQPGSRAAAASPSAPPRKLPAAMPSRQHTTSAASTGVENPSSCVPTFP